MSNLVTEAFTVFSSNAIVLDHSVYQLWLLGKSVDQAVAYRRFHLYPNAPTTSTNTTTTSAVNISNPVTPNQTTPQVNLSSLSLSQGNVQQTQSDEATGKPKVADSQELSQVDQRTIKAQPPSSEPRVTGTIVRNYVLSQYRTFEQLEHYLHRPAYLADQYLLPLSREMRAWLIERYYHFDQSVIRELLGKKLNSRSRKDLDEVCEKTKVPIGSCKRQFDNLKRIMKRVEDVENRPFAEEIEENFMLTKEQASQYAHIIFINNNRLDTSHKKLRTYTFLDFEFCGSVLQKYWTTPSQPTMDDFDLVLTQDLRELKPLLLNSREAIDDYKNHVLVHVTGCLSTQVANASDTFSSKATSALSHIQHVGDRLGALFKPLLRNLLVLGSGLAHTKETRDIFVTIIEKILEPCLNAGIGPREFDAIMDALIAKFSVVDYLQVHCSKRVSDNFVRLINGIRGAGVRLMRRHPIVIKKLGASGGVVINGKAVSDVV